MPFRKNAPDKRVHFLRLLRRRGASCPDGPNRLVGNDDTVEIRGCQPAQTADNLLFDSIERLALITLVKRVAHADYYCQARGQTGLCFAADTLICCKKVLPAFGMTHDYMR